MSNEELIARELVYRKGKAFSEIPYDEQLKYICQARHILKTVNNVKAFLKRKNK